MAVTRWIKKTLRRFARFMLNQPSPGGKQFADQIASELLNRSARGFKNETTDSRKLTQPPLFPIIGQLPLQSIVSEKSLPTH
jgi:hypothetical protein